MNQLLIKMHCKTWLGMSEVFFYYTFFMGADVSSLGKIFKTAGNFAKISGYGRIRNVVEKPFWVLMRE